VAGDGASVCCSLCGTAFFLSDRKTRTFCFSSWQQRALFAERVCQNTAVDGAISNGTHAGGTDRNGRDTGSAGDAVSRGNIAGCGCAAGTATLAAAFLSGGVAYTRALVWRLEGESSLPELASATAASLASPSPRWRWRCVLKNVPNGVLPQASGCCRISRDVRDCVGQDGRQRAVASCLLAYSAARALIAHSCCCHRRATISSSAFDRARRVFLWRLTLLPPLPRWRCTALKILALPFYLPAAALLRLRTCCAFSARCIFFSPRFGARQRASAAWAWVLLLHRPSAGLALPLPRTCRMGVRRLRALLCYSLNTLDAQHLALRTLYCVAARDLCGRTACGARCVQAWAAVA